MRLRRAAEGTAAATFDATPRPADGAGWREGSWCAVDLEMTGLDPRTDEIVAIGAVPILDGRVVLGGGMYTLVRASKRSQVGAVLVHKLRLADVADAPTLDEGIDLLLEALAGRVPVFHTAAIETAFLGRQFARRHVRLPAAADTEALGRAWLRHRDGSEDAYPRGIALGRLAEALGQPGEALSPRARRRPDHGAGVHCARHPARHGGAADRRLAAPRRSGRRPRRAGYRRGTATRPGVINPAPANRTFYLVGWVITRIRRRRAAEIARVDRYMWLNRDSPRVGGRVSRNDPPGGRSGLGLAV